jgi:hypothetical protein
MSELRERFSDGLFEARWQPGAQPEVHRGENKQSCRAEEESEADKMEHIVIELTNMAVLALVMPVSKLAEEPDPINSDTTISLWDIIEIILKMIIDGTKAMFQRPEISRQAAQAR